MQIINAQTEPFGDKEEVMKAYVQQYHLGIGGNRFVILVNDNGERGHYRLDEVNDKIFPSYEQAATKLKEIQAKE